MTKETKEEIINPKDEKKNLGGRPYKLNDTRLDRAEEILNATYEDGSSKDNAIILTNEELCIEINRGLDEKDTICYASFKNYKRQLLEKVNDSNTEIDKVVIETFKRFLSLIKNALVLQKQGLFEKLKGDDKQRQRWARIIERKFTEWNLRNINENTHKGDKQNPIQILLPDNKR